VPHPGRDRGVDRWWSEIRQPRRQHLVQQQLNNAHNSLRAIGERGNTLLKMTFKALRNVSLNPWWIGKIVAARWARST
jgi:outer membrane protein TolC